MSKVIVRYTPIPIQKEKIYVNAYDYPNSIDINVYEGENTNIKNNLFLGKFSISNLPRKKKDEIEIKILFKINQNSILEVTAFEKGNITNSQNKEFNLEKNNDIQIINPKGLMLIINELKDIENSMEYIEDMLYIEEIKDSIIEAQNKINELKKNEGENKERIKEIKKSIIYQFNTFIKKNCQA